jgi:hypothetical protein
MSLSEYLPRRIDFQYCAPFMHELIEFSLTNSMHNGEDHCIMEFKKFELSSFEETKEEISIEYKYFKEIYDRLKI